MFCSKLRIPVSAFPLKPCLIFSKKFGRAKSLSSIYASGSGLGLYVAKEIIKAHKGKIWAESDGEGKGSRFFVELP